MTRNIPAARITLLVSIAALALAPVSIAGKGRPGGGGGTTGGGSSSITISPAGPYVFGQAIYITTTVPIYPNGAGPYIWLKCYQNGVVVGTDDHAAFPGGWYYNTPFYLGPSASWSGGAANCTVTVVHTSNNKIATDASTSFQVSA